MSRLTLQKEENVTGEVWYYIMEDLVCLKAFQEVGELAEESEFGESNAQMVATSYYNECLERKQNGFPRKTVLLTSDIDINE